MIAAPMFVLTGEPLINIATELLRLERTLNDAQLLSSSVIRENILKDIQPELDYYQGQ